MWKNMKLWLKNHDYAWKYKLEVCLPLFVFLVLCDWIPKWVIQAKHLLNTGTESGFMSFNPNINPGAAENFLSNSVGGAIALATIVTIIVFIAFIFVNDKMWLIGILFVLAGSFANLLARSWAPVEAPGNRFAGIHGGVVDWIYVNWNKIGINAVYTNNMADNWIVVGIILFVAFIIVEIVKAVKEHKQEKKDKNENQSK